MPFQPSDIGSVYDFGLSTRDGAPLLCNDRNGKPVQTASIAYMTSIDKAKMMKEATELQEKSQLMAFASSNLIDREFDQWPQITQGDWSGGLGQRVSGSNNNQTQYWDGQGLIWPTNDYVPQVPLAGPVLGLPANFQSFPYNGMAGGYVNGAGMGYAYVAQLTTGAWVVFFQAGDVTYGPVTLVDGTSSTGIMHISIGGGFVWVLVNLYPGTTRASLAQLGMVAGVFQQIGVNNTALGPAGYGAQAQGIVEAAYVGNKLYVAVVISSLQATDLSTWVNRLWVLDYSAPGVPVIVTTTFPSATTGQNVAGSTSSFKFVDLCWQGTNLNISVSDGMNATILTAAPATFSTITTLAVLPGLGNAFICPVGATLFIVGATYGANVSVNRMELFTLNGGTLTAIAPINVPAPILDSITSPVVFGSYATWAVSYTVGTVHSVAVYAYDVIRNRLFRALTINPASFTGSDIFGHGEVAIFGTTTRTMGGGATAQAQFGIALFTGLISNNTETAREYYWGVLPVSPVPGFTGLLQMGTELTSGLIDFTAASNKLFRQAIVSFNSGLVANTPLPSVTFQAWFDQDPGNLTVVPDITKTISGASATPSGAGAQVGAAIVTVLPTQLAVPLNRVARKMVYRVTSSGGGLLAGGIWQQSVKIVSVATQVATGWVWDIPINLSPNVKTNTANHFVYQNQGQAGVYDTDHVVAYNFLKQLWRQRGGQCTLTLPNGESYPALIQSLGFESPKPFAASFRADQQTTYQLTAMIKIREDV
jgi:hypothetical protein